MNDWKLKDYKIATKCYPLKIKWEFNCSRDYCPKYDENNYHTCYYNNNNCSKVLKKVIDFLNKKNKTTLEILRNLDILKREKEIREDLKNLFIG
jgi:hypothetical protein